MSIITISRGTLSGGRMLAECLAARLGYRCIDREALVERAVTRRISEQDLMSATEGSPPGRLDHRRYVRLALIQAALTEEVRDGKAIYHGLAGHLLLKGVPSLLRLRIIAPLDVRVHLARQRLQLTEAEAISHIIKTDEQRRKWIQFLYGVDWQDPALYDFVINLEQLRVEEACKAVAAIVAGKSAEFTPESRALMDDLALASHVRAELALDPFTSNLEVEVEAHGGSVCVRGNLFEEFDQVERVVRSISGVVSVTYEEPVETAIA